MIRSNKYYIFNGLRAINQVDDQKVRQIARSILKQGWQGMPILKWGDELITGSHRITALALLERLGYEDYVSEILNNGEVFYDVSDIMEEYLEKNEMEFVDIAYDNLREYFAGTEVEKWKDELLEW